MKTLLTLAVLVVAMVLSTGCGAPATPVTPTAAATATTQRALPTVSQVTPTRPPTVAPTSVPPTPVPTAVTTPPTPTRAPATATRTRAPATKAPAVVPTKAGVPAASPTPKYKVPAGQAGLLVKNYFGQPLFYTLPGQRETRIEGNSEMFFVLDPTTYTVTASVPGQLQQNLTFDLKPNAITTQEFYAK